MNENNNLEIKPNIKALLSKIDTIVFDIDGVLINVSNSFRKTIGVAINFYFKEILKYQGDEDLVNLDEIKQFKSVGGFNNDWELTESIVLFYIAKSVLLDSKDLAVLRFNEPYLDRSVVSGVKEYEKEIFSRLDEKEQKTVRALWNKSLVRQIFQEMYAGEDLCYKFYGFEPIYFKTVGTIKEEIPMLDKSLIRTPFAILTGRAYEEARAAIDLLDLDISEEFVISDNGKFKAKPNPESLIYLSDKMNINLGLYIGDVKDDYLLVKNFNKANKEKCFLSAIITEVRSDYMDADIIADNVNEVLRLVNNA